MSGCCVSPPPALLLSPLLDIPNLPYTLALLSPSFCNTTATSQITHFHCLNLGFLFHVQDSLYVAVWTVWSALFTSCLLSFLLSHTLIILLCSFSCLPLHASRLTLDRCLNSFISYISCPFSLTIQYFWHSARTLYRSKTIVASLYFFSQKPSLTFDHIHLRVFILQTNLITSFSFAVLD